MAGVSAGCRYGKPESEWKRARDTDLVRCAQEWARSRGPRATRHFDRYCDPNARQRQLRFTQFFPAEHTHSRYRALLEALSSSLGIITSGRGRPITPGPRGTCAQRSRLFPDYPRKPGPPKWGVESELLRRDLVRSVPYQTTTTSHSPNRIVMRLTRSSNREFSWLNRAAQHGIMMTSENDHLWHASPPSPECALPETGKIQEWNGVTSTGITSAWITSCGKTSCLLRDVIQPPV